MRRARPRARRLFPPPRGPCAAALPAGSAGLMASAGVGDPDVTFGAGVISGAIEIAETTRTDRAEVTIHGPCDHLIPVASDGAAGE